MSNGPRIQLIWQEPAEPNGVIKSYTVFYSHSENTQKEISGIDALSYSVEVLGGVQYQFYVRAVTIKPGPNVSSDVKVPEFSEFSSILSMFCKYICTSGFTNARDCMGL